VDVQQYRDAATALSVRYREILDGLTALASNAQPEDEAWRAQYQAGIDNLKAANADARALSAPPCLAAVQDNLLAAATAYERAVTQAERGLETHEARGFRLATQTIAEADQFLNAVAPLAMGGEC
jgi:hypothetical protein